MDPFSRQKVRKLLRDVREQQQRELKAIEKDDVLWSATDIANYYGVHRSTVSRWDRDGLLPPPEKSSGWRRWSREEIVEALRRTVRIPTGPEKF